MQGIKKTLVTAMGKCDLLSLNGSAKKLNQNRNGHNVTALSSGRLLHLGPLRSLLAVAVLLLGMGCANAFCFAEAAARYQVNENILQAIAHHESRMNPSLVLRTSNGRSDIGLMGINTVHFEPTERLHRAGFTPRMMLDPCLNVMTGAYLLRLKMNRFGNTWEAVGAYHSTTDVYNAKYQLKIWEALRRVLAQGSSSDLSHGVNR